MSELVKTQPDLFLPGALAGLPSLRDDIDLMCHPFFSLEKGRTEPMVFNGELAGAKTKIVVTGADYGIANQWDNDLMLYLRAGVISAQNRGEEPSRRMRFHVYDFLRATRRGTSGRSYLGFQETLQRLKATSIITNVSKDGWTKDRGVSWIDSYEIITKKTKRGVVMAEVEVVVSEWAFGMMTDYKRALSIDPDYFDLTGALERKLYGIIRKGCGTQSVWWMELDKLRERCGSRRALRQFRYDIRKIIERQPIPGYTLELSDRIPIARGERGVLASVTTDIRKMTVLVVRQRHQLSSVRP